MADGSVVFTTELDAAGIKSGLDGLNGTINKWGAAIVGSQAFAKITEGLIAVTKAGIEYNAQMESYQTNFSVLLGDEAAALSHVAELREMAAKTPFGMEDLASANQTLLSFGISAEESMTAMQRLGDISLGNKERFSSLSLAFAQVSSAGKLTGQDLLQMINAGFNPLNTIAEKTGANLGDLKDVMGGGKGSKDFQKQMKAARDEVKKLGDNASESSKLLAQIGEDGMISAEMVGLAMQMETSPGGKFYNGMEMASQTMEGLWSTLQDDAMQLAGNVFEPLSDVLKEVVLPAALGAVGALNGLFESDGKVTLSVETQEALAAVEALDQKIIGIKNTYVEEAIKIKVEYEESMELIAELESLQLRLNETPVKLWSEADKEQLSTLTSQLAELNPQLKEFIGKDGILDLEAQKVRDLVTEYKNLALVKAAQKAQEAAWAAYYEAEVAAEQARVRQTDLKKDLAIAQQTADSWDTVAKAADKAYGALLGRTVDSIGVEAFTEWVNVARESMQSYIDLVGGFDAQMFTDAKIETDLFFDGLNLLDTDKLMRDTDAFNAFAAALQLVGTAAIDEAKVQAGTVEQISAELDANTTIVKAAEAAAGESLETAETYSGVIDNLTSATASTAEGAQAAAEEVATLQDSGDKLGESDFEPTVKIDDQATEPIASIVRDLEAIPARKDVVVNVHTRNFGSGTTVEGFAKGLDYVPYDNFPAYLHKGEMVLPAEEAEALRRLSSADFASGLASRTFRQGYDASAAIAASRSVAQTVNFYVPVQTPDEFAQTMREYAEYGLAGQ